MSLNPPIFGNMLRWSGSRLHFQATASPAEAQALPPGFAFEVRSTVDVYIIFGVDDTVEPSDDETSILFLRGAQQIQVPVHRVNDELVQYTHVSVMAVTDEGVTQFERIY